jgi:hypothetical protein
MTQGYGLSPEDLEAHKQHVAGVSDSLFDASTAAQGFGVPPNAFGLIGSFIPALLQPMITEASQVMQAAADSVDETSRMVGSTKTTYEDMESASSGISAALEGQL